MLNINKYMYISLISAIHFYCDNKLKVRSSGFAVKMFNTDYT